jgi:hypothetical protein
MNLRKSLDVKKERRTLQRMQTREEMERIDRAEGDTHCRRR